MGANWLLLLISFVFVVAVRGQTVVPCLTTAAECTQGAISGMSIINNNYYCCAPGYSMSMVNMQCSCTQTSRAEPCGVGPQVCRASAMGSFSTDFNGNTRCCKVGWSMQSMSGYVNGQAMDTCSCSQYIMGGGGSVFFGPGGVQIISGGDPNFNATAFEESMRDWSQSFSSGMHRMASTLQQTLGNMFRGNWPF